MSSPVGDKGHAANVHPVVTLDQGMILKSWMHHKRIKLRARPLARDNQSWLSGKQIFMPACPMDNQIFHIFVHIYYIGQVKISLGQPVLALKLMNN
jgi:hypothetical protein